MRKKFLAALLCAAMIPAVLCSHVVPAGADYVSAAAASTQTVTAEETAALSESAPAVPVILEPQTGKKVKKSHRAEIDYSNTQDGYVIVTVKKDTGKRWKAQVKGPSTTYTYNLTPKEQQVLPLTDGNGNYQITVYENVTGSSYAAIVSVKCKVSMTDELRPFLYPNQYVDYSAASKAVAKAVELTDGCTTELEMVKKVYEFVTDTLDYDKEMAATVKSGYLPVLDEVLERKKGICFDYAALMTGMLRSKGVPCKLVVGYAETAYHAWISVWTEEQGWIDNVVYFDGTSWQRMDPTFASGRRDDPEILKYIGNGANYTAKYFY